MKAPGDVVELLQLLVRTPSVNPSGRPGTDQVGEARCAEVIAEFLRGCGAEVWMQPVQPGRPNVGARFPTDRAGKKRIVFAPHTDTVSIEGMTIDPFGAEIRDGRLYGRGASDTKGPMAAMLWALFESRKSLPALGYEIWFAGLMGEETGQYGSRAWVREYAADFAIVGEPTSLDIVHAHKGSIWLTLTTRGKSCHASAPARGVNAIYAMADVIRCIRDEIAPSLSTVSHPILGSPTISVGTCHGGTKTNIVPDFCQAEVDIRVIPGQTGFLDEILGKLRAVTPGLEAEATESKPLHTDPDHPLIHQLEKSGGKCVGAPWFCDAAVFADAGVPAVAIGPGSIAQAHTDDEWIAVDELHRGVEFFRSFLSGI